MSIDLSNALSQQVNFGNLTTLAGLTSKTILFRLWLDAYPAATATLLRLRNVDGTDEGFQMDIGTTGKVGFVGLTFSTAGLWSATTDVIALSTWTQVAVTYNKSSTANDPILYYDSTAITLTKSVSPSGGAVAGTGGIFFIGGSGATKSVDGKIEGLCIYNRILTAAEIADAKNCRNYIPDWNGLLFAPNLLGAASLQTFDGATLGSTNYIYDMVSGAVGTPAGSPVGVADSVLNINAY